ncbi:hypothetical protein BFP72_02700 [Reichenbachiella sp. 5M10]|uniref:alpha/beta hydrolase n=1 Tax=Reichenbachiella sp. 5M10 TaxID=1889772 RepID=UPI000C15EC1B|nr:alpha/beta hydrolase [Reichenbachiella sp. 5M10]PIB34404.1 hypothetical protein BFP72_02700 [Reichenbachiella sp. 5M10]
MPLSDKLKKRLKAIVILALTTSGLVIVWLAYFFIANEAPILQGEVLHHIQYSDTHKLDIYLPTTVVHDESPVVVYFHGGAWVMGRKEALNVNRYHGAINTLRNRGYTIISPDYTLADGTHSPFPGCVLDAYSALIWIQEHADTYGLDMDNLGLMGESAGAHIAMMAAYGQPQDFSLELEIPHINYVIDVYGPSDLELLYQSQMLDSLQSLLEKAPTAIRSELDITRQLFGFDPRSDSLKAVQFMQTYSPMQYITAQAPPTLIIHGNIDKIVPFPQSIALKERLDTLGIPYEFHELEGTGHAFRQATPSQKDSVQLWLVDFIQRHYLLQN